MELTVTGIEEVQRLLTQAPKNVVAHGFLKALTAGANVIADAVEVRTPVKAEDTGGILDKGVLRESLMIRTEIDSQFRGGRSQIGFGANGVVAGWLEWGHALRSHKSSGKKDLGFVKARPFMRPALAASADAAIAAFAASLEETVKNEFGGK